jgi:hypothetical protein
VIRAASRRPPPNRDATGRGPGAGRDPAARRGSLAVGLAALVLAGSYLVGRELQAAGFRLHTALPPLTGRLEPRATWWVVVPFASAVGAVVAGLPLARRLPWRALLWSSFAAAALWGVSLALARASAGGLLDPVRAPGDYLAALPRIGAPGPFLERFVATIDAYPTHVRAHPPGLVVVLWWLDRAGLDAAVAFATIQHVAAASAAPAAMLAAREVIGEPAARTAAPFLVLTSSAVAWGSGDAVFLGVSAWAVAWLVLATGRRGRPALVRAVAGGLAGGAALLLSYGAVPLATVPAAVAIARRRLDVLVAGAAAAATVLLAPAGFGFSWWDGLTATRAEYAASAARTRPYAYYLVGNLAAFAVALGPAVVAATARLRDRRAWLLVGGGLAAVALADLSGLSKAEVERIWLPFVPWVALATTALGGRGARGWLGAQAAWAIAVAVLVRSPW